eukprot:8295666-Pyramimonas_sp.AAC.1
MRWGIFPPACGAATARRPRRTPACPPEGVDLFDLGALRRRCWRPATGWTAHCRQVAPRGWWRGTRRSAGRPWRRSASWSREVAPGGAVASRQMAQARAFGNREGTEVEAKEVNCAPSRSSFASARRKGPMAARSRHWRCWSPEVV